LPAILQTVIQMATQAPNSRQLTLNIDQLLTLTLNGLDQYFFKAHKEKARKLYKELADGTTTEFVSITFKGAEEKPVKLKLRLDASEYRGHLTFHMFKLALEQMMKNIAGKLRAKKDLNIFNSAETGEILVHLPGVIQDREHINVLVLGIAPSKSAAVIKLQFLDSEQFKKQDDDKAAEAAETSGQ
jgi:thioredoxin-related protein